MPNLINPQNPNRGPIPPERVQPPPANQSKHFWYGAAGQTRRTKGQFEDYYLFIDLGSFRTSVLCFPAKRTVDYSFMTEAVDYIVRWSPSGATEGEISFPSAFSLPETPNAENEFQYVPDLARSRMVGHIVESAKISFAQNYAVAGRSLEDFNIYIRRLLQDTFKYILTPNPKRRWNHPEVPRIKQVRVTVPDLFIENLRDGFRDAILEQCCKLKEDTRSGWDELFPEDLDINKPEFVLISSDESGACALYFLNLLREVPSWNFSAEMNRKADLGDVARCFSQDLERPAGQPLQFALCHLDIGGLTTDASVFLLRTQIGKIPDVATTLIEKESFGQSQAGEYLRSEFEKSGLAQKVRAGQVTQQWWESEDFIKNTFNGFLSRILQNQYDLIRSWKEGDAASKSEKIRLDGVYYMVSGRPIKAKMVREAILANVMRIFNSKENELLLLPDHCLFMAGYSHVSRNEQGRLYAAQIPDFEKLVTILGNVYTLYGGYGIEQSVKRPAYYVSMDIGREGAVPHRIMTDQEVDTGTEFQDLVQAFATGREGVVLEFAKHEKTAARTKFLCVWNIGASHQVYPQLIVPAGNEDPRTWIIPSIRVQNLKAANQTNQERRAPPFDLMWGTPKRR